MNLRSKGDTDDPHRFFTARRNPARRIAHRRRATGAGDQGGKSACNGPCAANWPPLLVVGDGRAAGDWTIIVREDGGKQWAFKGKPLYTWSKDTKGGDKTGDGVNGAWHVAKG